MGKKKRGHPNVEDILSRPWCYYCERDFEDLKLLISHQKAKHFKCDRCGKRLNTAGGLSVHMNQVHKESLDHVENALPNRQGLDTEIFGMEGVPEDVIQQHTQRIVQNFYQAQAERFAATGNPPPGQNGDGQRPTKKIKTEAEDELKKRLAEFRQRKAAQKLAGANGNAAGAATDGQSPSQKNSPFQPPQPSAFPPPQYQAGFPAPGAPGAPPYPATTGFPAAYPAPGAAAPLSGAVGFTPLPARPPSNITTAEGLPQRPQYGSAPGFPGASAGDPLAAASAARQGDDIDQMIRMVTEGIRPPGPPQAVPAAARIADAADEAGATGADKKGKKDKEKNVRMIYSDADFSPEERMARLARYAFAPEVA